MPVAVHRKIRLACGDDARGRNFDFDHLQPGDMMDFECSPDLTQVEIDAAVASLRANDSIVPALRLRIAIMDGELADIKAFPLAELRTKHARYKTTNRFGFPLINGTSRADGDLFRVRPITELAFHGQVDWSIPANLVRLEVFSPSSPGTPSLGLHPS